MNPVSRVLLLVIALALCLPLLLLLLPLSIDWRIRISLFVSVSLLNAGVALLYLRGLKGFRQQFKVGYRYMAIAMLLYAVITLEFPLFDAFRTDPNLSSNTLVYILMTSPFLLFFSLYYIGLRKIANILNIKTRVRSPVLVGAIAVIIGLVAAAIPPAGLIEGMNDNTQRAVFGMVGAGFSLLLASMILLFRLKQQAGPLYRSAFAWNLYGFLAFFVLQVADPSLLLPSDHWYVEYGMVMPFLIVATCFLKAAYEFN